MLIDFRELFPKYNIRPKGVIHVGANVGEEANVYLELGIKKQFWYEPNPGIYERLRENLRNNKNAIAFNYAVGDVDNVKVVLHIANNGGQSSSILDLGTHIQKHPEVHYINDIEVTMRRLDTLIFEHEIIDFDFLNIDVQGAELKVLKGMGKLLEQFKWAYLEVNKEELYKGCALVGEVDEYLYTYGFERVETKWCGNTGWGDALYIKK